MHYYQFNIPDYQSHTKHLTPIEDICYRRLLDWQYLHEKPIPIDVKALCRLIMLRDYVEDVEQILFEFFVLTDDGWINQRAFEEINQYHDKSKKASEAGKASAAKRLSKNNGNSINDGSTENEQTLNERSTDVQPTINQEPLTNNHKPGVITHTDYPSQQSSNPTPAASVCLAIKKIGIIDLNPSHPELLMLIEAGATIDEFMHAARTAKDKSKGFAYVLGIVKGQRTEAANAKGKVLQGKIPNKADALLQNNLETVSDWEPPEMRAQK